MAGERGVRPRIESLLVIVGYALTLVVASLVGSYDTGFLAAGSEVGAYAVDKGVQRCAFVAGLLGSAAFAWGRPPGRSFRWLLAFSLPCYLAGLVCPLAAAAWAPQAAGVLLGLGNAGFYALWTALLASRNADEAAYEVAVGSLLAGAALLAQESWGVGVGLLAIALAIGISAAILVGCWRAGSCGRDDGRARGGLRDDGAGAGASRRLRAARERAGEALPLFAMPVVCVASFVFVKNFTRSVVLDGVPFDQFLNLATAWGRVGSAVLLVVMLAALRRMPDFSSLYRVLGPAVSIAFMLVFLLGSGYLYVLASFTFLASSFVSMLVVLTCIKESQDEGYSATVLYGVFAGVAYGFGYLGIPLGEAFAANASAAQACALLVVGVNAVSIALTMADSRRTARLLEVGLAGGADNAAGDTARSAGGMADGAGLGALGGAPGASAADQGAAWGGGPLIEGEGDAAALARIASEHGLSQRETDVLGLLVKGRDIHRIAEALFISTNTVRTHTRNIYRKLGIHSRQELLDMLDAEAANGPVGPQPAP